MGMTLDKARGQHLVGEIIIQLERSPSGHFVCGAGGKNAPLAHGDMRCQRP